MSPEDRRLASGLAFSLLFHALLLSLTFGGQVMGLAGFGLPGQDRRIEPPELRVVLLPAPVVAAESLPSAAPEPPVAAEPGVMTVVYPAPPTTPTTPTTPPATPPQSTAAAVLSQASPKQPVKPDAAAAAAPAVPVAAPVPAEQPQQSVPPPAPREDVMALAQSDEATWAVPAKPEVPAPAAAPTPSASSPVTATPPPRDAGDAEGEQALELARLDQAKRDAQRKAEQREVERQEAARQEAARQEAARAEAARAEVERQEAARQVAARQDAARQEAARQEAARQQAAQAEAARAEAERQAAARQEAARQEAGRQEAARAEAARGEAARQEAGRIEAARLAALQAEAEKREERLRAIARQLNAEADRRDAAEAAQRLSPGWSRARRGRVFGYTDANAELIAYAQAWSRKIHLNMTFDMVREAARQPHTDPMVTVAIRSDGSVESVTFVRSSGVPALDEAIRRVVYSQANYPAFPPGLLQEYDVVEIRRTWHIDMAIRLQ